VHDVGLHRFKIHAILEVMKLCADANAAQNSGVIGSEQKVGVGL
jgi:hypothetical protein